MDFENVQRYVNKRADEPGRAGRKVSPTTIKKELTTLTTVWNCANELGHVNGPLPKRGLRFPKTQEKPPFQIWTEIERKIQQGNLSDREQAELWNCLFLTLAEIDELLAFVEQNAVHPVILPMFAFVAHTGARRSEMIRSQFDDIDLDAGIITIREKKRVKGRLTTRAVPISPFLAKVLRRWLAEHPGGQHAFCLGLHLSRSTKYRSAYQPLTVDEARDHFETTLAGSKWEKLRGWHVFRHSFCSNCAAAGIDQRIINAWVGHQTEEMVKRYRHLIPNQQQDAIRRVFSESA
jgi:integrase